MKALLLKPLLDWAARLERPRLLALTAALFLVNLLIPDFLPFIDEILLALATLVLASRKKPDPPTIPPPPGPPPASP
jgi:hypothetical protein